MLEYVVINHILFCIFFSIICIYLADSIILTYIISSLINIFIPLDLDRDLGGVQSVHQQLRGGHGAGAGGRPEARGPAQELLPGHGGARTRGLLLDPRSCGQLGEVVDAEGGEALGHGHQLGPGPADLAGVEQLLDGEEGGARHRDGDVEVGHHPGVVRRGVADTAQQGRAGHWEKNKP